MQSQGALETNLRVRERERRQQLVWLHYAPRPSRQPKAPSVALRVWLARSLEQLAARLEPQSA